ncbi:hypothetical protein [Rahnella inusitata]|uniref:hypothetical protein n=1 Tax=Rahnella inusitata TaxID=58169 RepID=UPI0039BECBD0
MIKIILLILLVVPLSSHAVVFGGSNLGFSGYPEFTDPPPSPPFSDDQFAWDSYKNEVQDYMNRAKQYVDDSDSDIKRIEDAKDDAIRKANDAVNEYNSRVRGN